MGTYKELVDFFDSLDRGFFIDTNQNLASLDRPLPIGYGQTISQPSLVLQMTQKLNICKNHKILEIGTGSGYQTAFLAEFAKEVYTVERIEPLLSAAQNRLTQLGYTNIHYSLGDGTYGLPEYEPYDRIIVAAAASMIPDSYIDQLKPMGIIIIPVGDTYCQELLKVSKNEQGDITEESIETVRFVPLVGECEI